MRQQVCFGSVNISLARGAGVITLDPSFDGGSKSDEQDWNDMIDWISDRGFEVGAEPVHVTADGTEVYALAPATANSEVTPDGTR